jgi:hypothetical protein
MTTGLAATTTVPFLGDVVIAPTSAFKRMSPASGWRRPLAVLTAASLLVGLASVPFTVAVVERVASAAVNDEVLAGLQRWLIGIAFARAGWTIVKVAFLCWILWMSLTLKEQAPSARLLMVVATYASLALVAEDASRIAVVWLRGIDQVRGPQDLQSYVGLDAFIRTENIGTIGKLLLSKISIFSLWFVTLIRGGLIGLGGIAPRTATVTALLCWIYLLVIQVGMGLVISSVQSRP